MSAIKADVTAATRLLNAAVRKARTQIADSEPRTASHGDLHWSWRDYDREAIVEMFNAAQVAADVLLEARP